MALSEGQGWRLLVVGRGAIGYYQRYAQQQGLVIGCSFSAAGMMWPNSTGPRMPACCRHTTIPAPHRVGGLVARGAPCVTTSFDGSSECIRDGETGFVVESPDQVPMIARALQQLGDDRVLGAMSAKASDLASVLSMRRHARIVRVVSRDRGSPCAGRSAVSWPRSGCPVLDAWSSGQPGTTHAHGRRSFSGFPGHVLKSVVVLDHRDFALGNLDGGLGRAILLKDPMPARSVW
ncbi:MAG: hypothetical protein U0231_14495 [Nitrospiraceae bacterium]